MSLDASATTANRPDLSFPLALQALASGIVDPFLGPISCRDIQLCPQNHGILSSSLLASYATDYPQTRFRFHANVRLDGYARTGYDASLVTPETLPYYEVLGQLSDAFSMPAYSLHAGLRERCSLTQLADNWRALQACFHCPVAIEPMYPASGHPYLLDRWDELAWLYDSGIPYALDLSHVQILAHLSRHRDENLLLRLLTGPHCLEIHLSDNDGRRDRHTPFETAPWWWDLFVEARRITSQATVFYEGNHALPHGRPRAISQFVSSASGLSV